MDRHWSRRWPPAAGPGYHVAIQSAAGPMKAFPCPKCRQESIPVKDKYLASVWMSIRCASCGTRLCAAPILMTLLYFLYFWLAAWFISWAWMESTWIPILIMIPLWLLLDFLSVLYMPLLALRSPKSET